MNNKKREYRIKKYSTPGWSLTKHSPTQSYYLQTPLGVDIKNIEKKLKSLPGVDFVIVADVTFWHRLNGYQFFFNTDLEQKDVYIRLKDMFNLQINVGKPSKKGKEKPAKQPPE